MQKETSFILGGALIAIIIVVMFFVLKQQEPAATKTVAGSTAIKTAASPILSLPSLPQLFTPAAPPVVGNPYSSANITGSIISGIGGLASGLSGLFGQDDSEEDTPSVSQQLNTDMLSQWGNDVPQDLSSDSSINPFDPPMQDSGEDYSFNPYM